MSKTHITFYTAVHSTVTSIFSTSGTGQKGINWTRLWRRSHRAHICCDCDPCRYSWHDLVYSHGDEHIYIHSARQDSGGHEMSTTHVLPGDQIREQRTDSELKVRKCRLSSARRGERSGSPAPCVREAKRLSGWRWKATHYFLLHHHTVAHSWWPTAGWSATKLPHGDGGSEIQLVLLNLGLVWWQLVTSTADLCASVQVVAPRAESVQKKSRAVATNAGDISQVPLTSHNIKSDRRPAPEYEFQSF